MNKKILIVAGAYPPEISSGANLIKGLAWGFKERGNDVFVLTTRPRHYLADKFTAENLPEFSEEKGIKVIRAKTFPLGDENFLTRPFSAKILFWKARKYFSGGIDEVIVCDPPLQLAEIGVMVKKKYGAHFILNLQSTFPHKTVGSEIFKSRLAAGFFKRMERRAYHEADVVAVNSMGNKDILAEKIGIAENKIAAVPNWMDAALSAGAAKKDLRKDYGLENKFVFLFSGIMGQDQGLEFLVSVAEKVKRNENIVFLLVGDGPSKQRIKSLAEESMLFNMIFKDFVSDEDYPSLIKIADIGVACLAESSKVSSMPEKIFDYLAAGKPVLAILNEENEGLGLVREAQCGVAVKAGDLDGAEKAVRAIYEGDRAELKLAGERGRRYADEHFALNFALDKLEELFVPKNKVSQAEVSMEPKISPKVAGKPGAGESVFKKAPSGEELSMPENKEAVYNPVEPRAQPSLAVEPHAAKPIIRTGPNNFKKFFDFLAKKLSFGINAISTGFSKFFAAISSITLALGKTTINGSRRAIIFIVSAANKLKVGLKTAGVRFLSAVNSAAGKLKKILAGRAKKAEIVPEEAEAEPLDIAESALPIPLSGEKELFRAGKALFSAWDGAKSFFGNAVQWFGRAADAVVGSFKKVVSQIGALGGKIWDLVLKLLRGAGSFAASVAVWLGASFKNMGVKILSVTGFAAGRLKALFKRRDRSEKFIPEKVWPAIPPVQEGREKELFYTGRAVLAIWGGLKTFFKFAGGKILQAGTFLSRKLSEWFGGESKPKNPTIPEMKPEFSVVPAAPKKKELFRVGKALFAAGAAIGSAGRVIKVRILKIVSFINSLASKFWKELLYARKRIVWAVRTAGKKFKKTFRSDAKKLEYEASQGFGKLEELLEDGAEKAEREASSAVKKMKDRTGSAGRKRTPRKTRAK